MAYGNAYAAFQRDIERAIELADLPKPTTPDDIVDFQPGCRSAGEAFDTTVQSLIVYRTYVEDQPIPTSRTSRSRQNSPELIKRAALDACGKLQDAMISATDCLVKIDGFCSASYDAGRSKDKRASFNLVKSQYNKLKQKILPKIRQVTQQVDSSKGQFDVAIGAFAM